MSILITNSQVQQTTIPFRKIKSGVKTIFLEFFVSETNFSANAKSDNMMVILTMQNLGVCQVQVLDTPKKSCKYKRNNRGLLRTL